MSEQRTLNGPEKAALLMLTIGEENAGKLFSMMHDDEIRELSQHMSSLGSVGSNVTEKLVMEFAENFSTAGAVGSYETAERLLGKVLDKSRLDNIMDEIRGPAGRTLWDKLDNVNENILANYLKNEYPQTVAVVLSKVSPPHAAKVLGVLPENFSMEVIMRMLRMETVQKDVLSDVEKTLRSEFMSNLARSSRRDPHEVMAEIFNSFDRNTEARFMGSLEERHRDAADKIKALMFTFDDLARLDGGSIQTLLKVVEKDKLPRALKGASQTIRDLFFSNMSERAAKIMKEDMDGLGPVRLREVDEAQIYIVTVAKDLAAKGEIVIAAEGGDDQLIY
ncbi:MAG: flagellar motor switch protein FliG [Alphaproteobacteria bacterium]|nr:MAG: flagellar motor switch protein FliG [Alphaproteobacteria bacterium]